VRSEAARQARALKYGGARGGAVRVHVRGHAAFGLVHHCLLAAALLHPEARFGASN
jgi:hypothetical protein